MKWANRVENFENEIVDNILSLAAKQDIISFAGGMPSPNSFPIEKLATAYQNVLIKQGASSLQYGPSQGYLPLRQWIVDRLTKEGITTTVDNIMITNGSQQALELVAKALIDPNDVVIVEKPTYLAAIQCFKSYEANLVSIDLDEEGMIADKIEGLIREYKPKFIYVNPTFQNPTGVTMGLDRRKKLCQLAQQYQIPILEDNPYGDLRYNGKNVASIYSLSQGKMCLYTGTFSKIIAPGLRVGYIVGSQDVIKKLAAAKQSSDVLTNSLTQRAVHEFLSTNNIDDHIKSIIKQYTCQRDAMNEAMKKYFPENISWTNADGGMFIWVTLPQHCNTIELLKVAIKEKVAFVPGQPFFADSSGLNTMRLNFSNSTPERIEEGISRLGKLLNQISE